MKKIFSLLMCAVMLLCITSPVFATEKCGCGFSPVIYVGPLGCTPIVRDAGSENEQQLWKTDTAFLLDNLKKELPRIGKALLTGSTETLGDALVEFVNASFSDLALDSEGKSKMNVTTPELNVPEGSRHSVDSDYYFDYDFRLDPFEHADRLHDFIEQVKELTGHDSVKLKCSSMGGVVLSAYLEKYGCEGLDVIICRCCPLWGTAVAGEAFCGRLELNATALARYGEDAIPFLETGFADDFIEGILYQIIETLRFSGVLSGICALGGRLIDELGERIFNEALIPVFGTLPGIWSFVPEEYFEDAVKFMKLPEEGGLHDKVYSYRTAMANIAENLNAAKSNGTSVCLICGYNVQRTPLVTLWRSTSDGTVDTKYASLGATCAQTKEFLPDEYLKTADSRYLSPDGMIDASSCALPDNTWFVRNWLHCNGNAGIDGLFSKVMTAENPSTDSFDEYPQFLEADDDADTVYPVTGAPDELVRLKEHPSFLNLVRWFYSLIKKLFSLFPVKK